MAIEDRQSDVVEEYENVKDTLSAQQQTDVEHLLDAFAEMYEDDTFSTEELDAILTDIRAILNK
jgi:hypothetical protein